MADLSYTVEVGGTDDLGKLAAGIGAVTKALDSGKDNAKKLADFKAAMGGMGDATSSLQTLEAELRKLNTRFKSSVKGMSSGMKSELEEVRAAIQTSGLGIQSEMAKVLAGLATKSKADLKKTATEVKQEMVGPKGLSAALSAGVNGVGSATTTVKQAIAGHYNALGIFVSTEQAKLAAEIAGRNGLSAALAAGVGGVAKSTATVKQAIAGHYNALGIFVSAEQAKLAAQASKPITMASGLALGANTVGSGARGVSPFAAAIPKPQDIAQVKALSTSFQKLTIDGNDVHSAMRGLASGFNLLWLTWGNLLPLFAGAAISNGFMKTAKEGLKVTQTLGTIAYLGENTATEMQALTGELVRMGNDGIYGPMAIADAMQVLSLAGLKANEILAVTGTVMGFSVAGATDIKAAADVLVSVTTAFGTGAAGFSRSADIIMRAAADSKASVESFGEAMKTASVVGEQYGAKQEDVALLIQYLANLGIQGSAAGTAVRNMYADISGRSGPARKAMKELGLEFRDADGHVIGLKDQSEQLLKVLSQYDGKSRANIIQAIYGERGGKAAIEMLAKAKTFIIENGKAVSQLELDQRKLEAAYGDSAIAAIKMGTTTQNAFKAAGATLQTTLFGAFTAMEPQLYAVAVALREAFGSKDLQDALSKLVGFIADIAKYVAENIQTIVTAGLAYGAYKLAVVGVTLAYGLYQNVLSTINAAKAINLARTTAQTVGELELGAALGVRTAAEIAAAKAAATTAAANAGKLTVLGSLAKAIPFVGTAITLAGLAWMGYDMWANRSADTMEDLSGKKADDMISALNKESEHLEKVNGLRRQGLTLLEAEARLKETNASADIKLAGMSGMRKVQSELDQLKAEKANAANMYGANPPSWAQEKLGEMDRQIAQRQVLMRQLGAKEQQQQNDLAEAQKRLKAESKAVEDLNRADTEAQRKKDEANALLVFGKPGSRVWEQETSRDSKKHERYYDDKAITAIKSQMDSELSVIKSKFDEEKTIQDNSYKNLLTTQADYYAASAISTAKYEQDSVKVIDDSVAEYVQAFARKREAIAAIQGNSKVGSEDYKRAEAELQKTVADAETFLIDSTNKKEKIQIDSNKRIITSLQDIQGETMKLIKTDKEYWEKNASEAKKAQALDELADKYRYINTSIFSTATAEKAAEAAKADANASHQVQLDLMKKELQLRIDNADALTHMIQLEALSAISNPDANLGVIQELQNRLAVIRDGIAKMKGQISESMANALEDGAIKGGLAFKREMDAKAEAFTNGLTDSLETALTQGGKAGAKQLRKFLTDEIVRKPFLATVKMMIQPFIGAIMGMMGMGGGGGAAGAAGGGAMGMFSTFMQGTSLYSGLTSGTGLLGTIGGWLGMGGGAANAAALAGTYAAPGIGAVGALGSLAPTAGAAGGITGAISSALGAIPVWGWAAMAVAALWKPLFGRKLKDSGIQGEFGGESGFEGESYEFYKGGLFRSDKTKTSKLSEEMRKMLGDTFIAMRKEVTAFADALGLDTARLEGFTSKIKLSTIGLSEEDAKKKIEEALLTANNELAEQVIGTWTETIDKVSRQVAEMTDEGSQGGINYRTIEEEVRTSTYTPSEFAKDGEKAIDTLRRLATSLITVNAVWDTLGYKMLDASLAGGDLASKIIDAFGTIERFAELTSSYYQNFYSESERKVIAARQMDAEMKKLGFSTPKTRDEFRKLVEAQDLTTEAGRKAYAALLALSPVFADIVAAAEDVEDAVTALHDALEKAYSALEKAVAAENKLLEEQRSVAQDLVNSWKDIYEAAKSGAEDLFGAVSSTAAGAAARGMIFIENAVTSALAGIAPDKEQFNTAISDARGGLVSENYSSQFELDRDRLVVANHLAEIQAAAGEQMTLGELTIARLDKQIKQNNDMLDYWREQIDIANGTYEATLSVTDAIDALKKLMFPDKGPALIPTPGAPGGASWGGGSGSAAGAAPPSKYSRVTSYGTVGIGYAPVIDKDEIAKLDKLSPIYHSFDGTGNLKGLLEAIKAAGGSMSDLEVLSGFFQNDWIRAAEAVGIPAFSRGTNYVNEDMLAVIHKGEAVIPAAYNNNNNNNEGDRAILIQLAQDIRSIKESTRQHADQFDKVTAGGNAILTETV